MLDGFVCALKLLELFEQYGLRHSRVLTYAATLSKDLTGLSSRFTHACLKIRSQLMFRCRRSFYDHENDENDNIFKALRKKYKNIIFCLTIYFIKYKV